ncbi:protein of unknown function [Lachnospiraceae bacterium G11]|nr:protein of unknown function [Lachnospiraceae bacterium G11]
MSKIRIRTISSLEKCLADGLTENTKEIKHLSLLKNETASFQVAYQMEDGWNKKLSYFIRIEGPAKDYVKIFRVIEMPSATPVLDEEHDKDIIGSKSGLYPDLLLPVSEDEELFLTNHRLLTLWIDVEPRERISGRYPIEVAFYDDEGNELGRAGVEIDIIDELLPRQEIIHTEWFYCDTLMSYYHTSAFDDKHFEIIEKFMKKATENGINMILTPVFTYALDTAVGKERPTTQLVKAKEIGDSKYEFDFELFDRFINLAKKCGYEYFEMGHLFTQWGAKATPKIMAETREGYKRIFGWDVASDDMRYFCFLQQFMPRLVEELKRLKVFERTFYHISDEPRESSIDNYKAGYDLIKQFVPEDRIIDAMSNYSFYEKKVLSKPVPSTSAIKQFIDAGVGDLWTYYCCDARIKLSNRYFAMPAYRTRVLGIQLYLYDIVGFLHWGYNFYFSQYSLRPINPFVQTDCDGFAESGDAFLVYPGPDGEPLDSIRLKLIRDAFQDIRALKLLEKKKGKAFVRDLIKEELGEITFTDYPRFIKCYVTFREKVNCIIGD